MAIFAPRGLTLNATPLDFPGTGVQKLVQRTPLRALGSPVRQLIIPEVIGDVLDGKVISSGFPTGLSDARVAQYIAGQLMFVSLCGTSLPHVDLERLKNVDEVWMFCFRRPKPGWRLFGRFFAQNKFYGLRLYDRHELPDERSFAAAAEDTILDYEAILGGAVLRGSTVTDYLSGVWRDVDDQTEY